MRSKTGALVPTQQLDNLDVHTSLFPDFADHRLFRGLAWRHTTAWQFPEARIVAFDEEDLLVLYDNGLRDRRRPVLAQHRHQEIAPVFVELETHHGPHRLPLYTSCEEYSGNSYLLRRAFYAQPVPRGNSPCQRSITCRSSA